MIDDSAGSAIVDCRIGVRIKDRRLQNSGWENNVAQRTVVGIARLWRHSPVGAIDLAEETAAVKSPVARGASLYVTDAIIIPNNESRIVSLMIGIPHLDYIRIEFP